MPTIKALDVSSHSGPISRERWRAARADGWELAVVQAWGGLPGGGSGPNPHCYQQLFTAHLERFLTAIYIVIPPDTTTQTHELIRVAKEAAGDEYRYLRAVALDIEDEDRRPLHPTDPDARLMDAIENLHGEPVWIYTSLDNWIHIMRYSEAFREYPLWDGRWGFTDGLDDYWRPYGGWDRCAMRQYCSTTMVHGISVDLNVADLDRLGVAGPPPGDLQAEIDRLLGLLEQARMLTRSASTTLQTIADSLRDWSER